jgi:hypothetical protein
MAEITYSTRYYQLTPEILIEYNYNIETNTYKDENIKYDGDINARVISGVTPIMKYFLIQNNVSDINLYSANFVIPTNSSQSYFVKPFNEKNEFKGASNQKISIDTFKGEHTDTKLSDSDKTETTYHGENANVNGESEYTLKFDKIRIYFTGKDYMDGYNGLIFQSYIYKKSKEKVGLMSFILPKSNTDVKISSRPLLINQKVYTRYVDVKILSTSDLLNYFTDETLQEDYDRKDLVYHLLDNNKKNVLLDNTPVFFSVYGIRYDLTRNNDEYYVTERINTISVPNQDIYDDIYVDIKEADDGEYFTLGVKCNSGGSFSDYMRNLDEDLSTYIVLHELTLTEHYLGYNNEVTSKVTHREQYIVNAISVDSESGDNEEVINEDGLDNLMYYRPVCIYGSKCFKFTIRDTLKILNTDDNTTIVKTATLTYDNPSRYGKRMNRIYMSETPDIVKVYNRRTDVDIDGTNEVINITNSSGGSGSGSGSTGLKIETTTQNITSFIESRKIACSISQVPVSLLDYDY